MLLQLYTIKRCILSSETSPPTLPNNQHVRFSHFTACGSEGFCRRLSLSSFVRQRNGRVFFVTIIHVYSSRRDRTFLRTSQRSWIHITSTNTFQSYNITFTSDALYRSSVSVTVFVSYDSHLAQVFCQRPKLDHVTRGVVVASCIVLQRVGNYIKYCNIMYENVDPHLRTSFTLLRPWGAVSMSSVRM